MTISGALHLILHVAVPAGAAWLFFRDQWWRAFLIMVATMLVDLDHLLATPYTIPIAAASAFIRYTRCRDSRVRVLALPKSLALSALGC